MTGDLERRYRRMLRVYPSTWRAENAEVVLGTLLDAAEAEGRDRPARGERLSLGVDGSAHRLDRSVAIAGGIAAFAASVLGVVFSMFLAVPLMELGLWWAVIVLLVVVGPIGLVVAITSLMRSSHRIGPRSAIAAVALSLPAVSAASVAMALWSRGFDDADAGLPVSAAQTGLLIGCAIATIVLGAGVIGLLSRPLFPPGALPSIANAVVAVVAAPFIGYAIISPLTGIVVSAAAVVLALVGGRPRGAASQPTSRSLGIPLRDRVSGETRAHTRATGEGLTDMSMEVLVVEGRDRTAPRGRRGWVVPTLATTAIVGLVSVVISLTGSLWLPGLDGTQAMGAGLGLGGLVATVMVGALASVLSGSEAIPRPAAIAAILAPATSGIGHILSVFGGADPWPTLLGGSALAGVAVAFLVARALHRGYPRLARGAVAAVAVLAGVGYTVIPGIMVAAYLPFVAPVVAGIVAWALRSGRRRTRPTPPVLVASG